MFRMILRKIVTVVWYCTWQDRRLLGEALIFLGLSKCAVSMLPFRWIAVGLGKFMHESPFMDLGIDPYMVARVGWAVSAISKCVPGTRQCLVQALAANWILRYRRMPSTIYFGVAPDTDRKLTAHAWVRSGTRIVTGGEGRHAFTVVASFSHE